MSLRRTYLFLVLLLDLWSPLRGAVTDITCTYMSSCILSCLFDPGPEVVIHWLCPPDGPKPVHTYYHDQDQLGHQNPQYTGRTALFKNLISTGNASLKLSRIQVADRGKYKCYTSTINGNNEEYINVNVQAPVVEVELQQEGDEVKCRSEGIYPKPEVTWTPPTEHKTVNPTEKGLYNIISSVRLSQHTAVEYSCNVSTYYSWRSATYRLTDPISVTDSKATIPCADTKTPIKSLLWTFNNTQTISNRTGSKVVNSESWRQFVDHVSDSGSLVLKSLTSAQQGLYSCVLKTDTKTYMTNTQVHVEEAVTSGLSTGSLAGIIVGGVLVLAATVAFIFLWQNCNKKKRTSKPDTNGKYKGVDLNETAFSSGTRPSSLN